MKFFQRIFSSAFIFYSKFKYEDPLYHGVIIVATIQLLLLFFLVSSIRMLTGLFILPNTTSPILWAAIAGILIFFVWRYFSKSDYKLFVEEYRQLSKSKRKIWAWIAGLIIPVLAFSVAIILILEKR